MRKRRKNHILSFILIFLILVTVTAGTILLLSIAGRNTHSATDASSETLPDTSASESLIVQYTEESADESSSGSSSDSVSAEESLIEESSSEESVPEPVPTLSVTIPDRSTFPEITGILADASGVSSEDIEKQAAGLIPLLPDPALAEHCYFPLEGYILSGTYELPEDAPILESILTESLQRISKLAVSDTYNVHEILSMASIIEIESSRGGLSEHHPDEMPHIASVIYNRLNSSMQLQMDVTFQYGYNTLQPHGADDAVLEQYNTYDVPALPLGPICSPSEDAVAAVLNPVASDDLFFVFDEEGNYYYAADYNVHLDNCVKAGIR